MAPRKKPDATDTEPPEEARLDTTAIPLLVDDGKLLPPEVAFTAVQLLGGTYIVSPSILGLEYFIINGTTNCRPTFEHKRSLG